MAAVAPDDANRNVCYGKPFETEALWGTNFTGKPWPADYVARREALGAKYCALPDGRRLCYWTDGDPGGVPVVAFHQKLHKNTPIVEAQSCSTLT